MVRSFPDVPVSLGLDYDQDGPNWYQVHYYGPSFIDFGSVSWSKSLSNHQNHGPIYALFISLICKSLVAARYMPLL